jgi:hypothetical protein
MIDVSPLLLWPVHDVLELMPFDAADNPQARRVAVLIAEAHAARQTASVLATLCEWGRMLCDLLLPAHPHYPARAELIRVLDSSEAIARSLAAHPVNPSELPDELLDVVAEASQGAADGSAEQALVLLATYALALTHRPPVNLPAGDAWQLAAAMLCAIAEAAGAAADARIARCADLAYRELFPSK